MEKEIKELDLDLDNDTLEINLELYKILKDIIQSKINSKYYIEIIENINYIETSEKTFYEKKEDLIKSCSSISIKNKNKIVDLLYNSIEKDISFKLLRLSLNIVRYRTIVLEKSKIISENYRLNNNHSIISYEYDYNMLRIPYSIRVSGALLIDILFEKIEDNKTTLYSSIKKDIVTIDNICPNTILQIIYAESASQYIRSSAGDGYEMRFKKFIDEKKISYNNKTFDEKLNAVEYDCIINTKLGKKIGVSIKRTLRERYKQNHKNIEDLDVDAMILITLGIDLNKSKIDYITQKDNHYIFVSPDLYDKIYYFKENEKVFSLDDISDELLENLI